MALDGVPLYDLVSRYVPCTGARPLMNRRFFLASSGLAGMQALFGEMNFRRVSPARDVMLPCGSARLATPVSGAHPTPRKGITGAKVLAAAKLSSWPDLQKLFDGIRAMPDVADGIKCSCGCAELPGYYSLLSCYEGGEAMAIICPICQGAGKLSVRLHGEGRSLAEIRAAVDAQFG